MRKKAKSRKPANKKSVRRKSSDKKNMNKRTVEQEPVQEAVSEAACDKPEKEKRYTTHRIKRSYEYASHDADGNFNGLTVEDWKKQILSEWSPESLKADSVCIIFHDKDKDNEGNPKGLHAHAIVHYLNKDRRTSSAVYKLSGCSRIGDCMPADNVVDAYRYLIHATEKAINEGKHVYDQDEVIVLTADGVSFDYQKAIARAKEKQDKKAQTDVVNDCLNKVRMGELTVKEVERMYQEDADNLGLNFQKWYKDKSMYVEAEKEWMQGMLDWYKTHPRCLVLAYICGDGESGKSELANKMAMRYSDRRGYHVAAAPGKSTTYDPVGKYHGEKVSIFNEMEGSNFTVKQFTDMFDPIHASDVNSRNVDKPWFASMAIFTNSISLETFIEQMTGIEKCIYRPVYGTAYRQNMYVRLSDEDKYHSDKVHQVRRRFVLNIEFCNYEQEWYADDDYLSNDPFIETVRCFRIYVRDASVKCKVVYPDEEMPFKLYTTVFPDIIGEKLTMRLIDQAIQSYYDNSGYDITPDTVEKPDLSKLVFAGADIVEEDERPKGAWIPTES